MFAHYLVYLDTICKLIYIEMQPIMNHNFQQARSKFGLDQHIDRYLCGFLAYFLRMFCMSMDRVLYKSFGELAHMPKVIP